MSLIRIWTEVDIDDVANSLVIVDDLHGFCPNCKKTGISYENMTKCPSCEREFKYVTTRENPKSASGAKIIAKIQKHLANLSIVDYSDYKQIADKKKAHSLFSK